MKYKIILVTILFTLFLSACGTPTFAMPTNIPVEDTLVVMTHDSFAVSEGVIADFEKKNNVSVTFIQSGDTGSSLNKAILSKENPIADVFYGVDNTFLSRALEEEIFEPYESPLITKISPELILDLNFAALPVDFGDVCINFDRAYFEENGLKVPETLEDLLLPEYKGLLVVENPAISSPGLAFLMATIAHFGEDGYLAYWEGLVENGLVVVNDWETAYYTNFSASSGQGPQPMVVSYSSSPAAEVYFATEKLEESPTGSIITPGTCFRQIEFAGILKGTQNRALAEKFIDFMLDWQFQEDVPLQMFVYPSNSEARLPEVFTTHGGHADRPAQLDPGIIAANRETWIQAWTETVLH